MKPAPSHRRCAGLAGAATLLLAACGGGGSNPLGNPPDIDNPAGLGGQRLSFVCFQKCIDPVLQAQLRLDINGAISTNSCAGGGCHSSVSGTGGALRVVPGASQVDLANAANTADVVRATAMYQNFYSSQGSAVPASPSQSRLLTKPLVQGTLHGGGRIFENRDDPNARLISYWINRPVPAGQDEFSSAANSMFTPPDPLTGTCNTE